VAVHGVRIAHGIVPGTDIDMVVACAAGHDIVTTGAVERVVSLVAEKRVGTGIADDVVGQRIAGAADAGSPVRVRFSIVPRTVVLFATRLNAIELLIVSTPVSGPLSSTMSPMLSTNVGVVAGGTDHVVLAVPPLRLLSPALPVSVLSSALRCR